MTDEKLRTRMHHAIDTRLSSLADDPFLAQRIAARAKGDLPMKKKFAAFPAFVAIILLLTLTAAVAVEVLDWHVLDWLTPAWNNSYDPTAPVVTGDTSHPVADVQIVEAVSDGYGVYLSVLCTPKEENVLLLNAFTTPSDDAAAIGITPDYPRQSIGAWADTHGYTLYEVRLHTISVNPDLTNNTGFDSATGDMQRTSDGSTIIMMGGGSAPLADTYQLNYTIVPYTQRIKGLWETDDAAATDTHTIAFTVDVPQTPAADVIAAYTISTDTPAQHINLIRCQLLRTPLAAYVEYVYTIRDDAIAQAERLGNDSFNLIHPQLLFSANGLTICSRETRPDGGLQFRILRSIPLPAEIPDGVDLDVRICNPIPGFEDLQDLITLVRIDQ